MANYQKYEKNRYSDDFKSVSKNIFGIGCDIAIMCFILICIISCINSGEGNMPIKKVLDMWLIMGCIVWFYYFLRYLYVNIKGEFRYNDTMLYYKGYSFDFIPKKLELSIPFTDIAAAKSDGSRGRFLSIVPVDSKDSS